MQHKGSRWKVLLEGQYNASSMSESLSKSNKFNPVRKANQESLTTKFKTISNHLAHTSSDYVVTKSKYNQVSLRQSNIRNDIYTKNSSPQKSDSQINLRYKLRNTTNSNQDLASPTPIIRELKKISNQENKQSNINPTKVLFSLDQEHRYIHEEIFRIKQDFIKLKELVLNQIIRQQKQMDQIVKKIANRIEQVLCVCSDRQNKPKFHQNNFRQETYLPLSCNQKIDSPDLNEINRQSSMIESKIELKNLFAEQSIKIEKSIDKALINRNFQPIAMKNLVRQPPKTDRLYQKKTNELSNKLTSRQRSKKQFEKLFSAVDSLKKQIKDINSINSSFVNKNKTYNMDRISSDLQNNIKIESKMKDKNLNQSIQIIQKRIQKNLGVQVNNLYQKSRFKTLIDYK